MIGIDRVSTIAIRHGKDVDLPVPVLLERLAGMFHRSVTRAARLTCESPRCLHGLWVDHMFATEDGMPKHPFEKCAVCASPLRVSHAWTRNTNTILEVKK